MPAAAPLAQLEAGNGDHFYPCLAHLGDRVGIALVRDDYAWLQRDGIVGVIPLLALRLVLVSAGFDHI